METTTPEAGKTAPATEIPKGLPHRLVSMDTPVPGAEILVVEWLILWWMYRPKIFLRI